MKKSITKFSAFAFMLMLLFHVTNAPAQNQIIGSFPTMAGGFEPLTAVTLASTTISTSWYQNSGGTSAIIGTTSTLGTTTARTGTKFLSLPAQSNSGKYPMCPYTLSLAASTSYVLQFYYRTATATSNLAVANYPDKNTGALALTASTSWTKAFGTFTTNAVPTSILSAGFKLATSGTPLIDFDDVVLYAGTTPDIIAPDAPTGPLASTTSATQMTVSWTAPATGVDGGGYVVVRSAVSDPTAVPNANGIYSVGNTVSDGTGVSGTVAYIGTETSFTDISLTASTHYFYRVYAVDKAFNYSSAIAVDNSTPATSAALAAEPTVAASTVTFSAVGQSSLTINWNPGTDATNTLVVVKSGAAVSSDPVDGVSYTPSSILGNGSLIGTANYVVYNGTGNSVTVTGLSKLVTYYVKVYSFNGSAGTENYLVTGAATSSQATLPGEIVSSGANSAGVAWATTTAWVGGIVPGTTDNVTIVTGDKIQVAASASCYNLTINSGAKVYNVTALPTSSLTYLTVYGNTITCNGTLGDKTADAATTDCAMAMNFVGNLTITGSGTIRPARLRPNASTTNATLTLDADVQMTYAGSAGTGGAGLYFDNSSNDNITLTVNAGKTLSFVDLSYLGTSSGGATTNGNAGTTINVNGTISLPVTSYLSLPITSTKTCTLNVNGTLNVGKLSAISITGGGVPAITVGGSGVINVNTLADFSSSTLSAFVGGTGAFNLNTGATMNIGAATGLDPVTGAVRTTTRSFSTGASYAFTGTVAQTAGSDLPVAVNNLTINNTTGVSLSSSTQVNGALTFTAGTLSLGANNLIIGSAGSIAGNSATAYVVTDGAGKLTQTLADATAKLFPVGASTSSFDPVSLTPTTGSAIAVNVGTTLPGTLPTDYTYNAKVWNITPVTPSSTAVTLTPSSAVTTLLSDVIGQYISGSYVNTPATKSGNAYTGTFSSFEPLVTGTSNLGTAVQEVKNTGISFDGHTIQNPNNLSLRVYDTMGRVVVSSTKNVNMSGYEKGVYIVKSNSGTLKINLIR
jgi:hypothetical protein